MTMLLFAYATAVTISFLYLLLSLRNGKPHDLESLPDLKPPKRDGEIALQLVPENAPMAPGHTLSLGESRRFGNIRVTAVAVTRGPLQFVHYTGEPAKGGRPPTNPVLKLWLRFENVSEDQEIAPLDELLTLTRVPAAHEVGVFRANNFLVSKSAKGDLRQEILVYDMPISWDWMIKGQNLDRELAPGESMETFIPSAEDGVDGLSGPLLWRVHFRKGYNPKSMRGVTTLVEVAFDDSEISADRNRT